MNVFEKLGLIQSSENSCDDYLDYPNSQTTNLLSGDTNEDFCAELETQADVSSDDVVYIAETYDLNGLSDTSMSVYKIQEMIAALPKEMPEKTKKATIKDMMPVIGLSYEAIVSDANNRCAVLRSAMDTKLGQLKEEKTSNEAQIESLKEQIEAIQKRNAAIDNAVSTTETNVNQEVDKIMDTVEFIGGEDK